MPTPTYLFQPVSHAAKHCAGLGQVNDHDHNGSRDLLSCQEQLVALADGLGKLLRAAHLPDVRKVLRERNAAGV